MNATPLDHLTRHGALGAPALILGAASYDYATLEAMVGRLAGWLLEQGLEPGDRVASWDRKSLVTCLMPLAAARAGLVHVPVNPVLKARQVAHILADSGASLLLAPEARGRLVEAEARWVDPAALGGAPLPPSDHDPDRLAALLYTSGSTGAPKGVMLSHANLGFGAEAVADYTGITPDTRNLAVMPLAFDYGQNQLLATWRGGGCVIPFDYLLPNDVKKAVDKHAATYLAGIPPLWHQLMTLDWEGARESLETLTNTGGHMSEPLFRQLRAAFPRARLHLMYGLTEAFRAASLDPELADAHPGSVGTAIPHAELMVVREDGSPCAAGEEGELVQAGPLVAQGYWQAPEQTARRFRPAPAHSRYGGNAVWSGDRFVRDADGLLHFRARADAMIKVSGNRLSPTEVEEVALAAPGVREAVITARPDPALGAAIVLHAVGDGDDGAVLAHFRRTAPSHFAPRRILWHEALPKGATGKVDRRALEGMTE
ncbi:AMP-binding protein [Sphingomicrobium astaxanthinifaciens]|uniref:AMP-binding protein n=1 Tax=Sphingomicrobium astaxanthinifaciens TaxID=1227949 RepID=UPI001FCB48F9|nr:AMP-binding protein [Sphingomicrobium astaxanthinifaciens]MCJ7422184.1 AMP-binding protein [Sphingomicrobium astaxanthinifaciens]